jgi:hypothetical protein
VSSNGHETLERLEKIEVLTQKGYTTMKNVIGNKTKYQTETLTETTTDMDEKLPSTEIGSPIQSITPL